MFGTIDGTSAFRSIVFKPNSTTISAANRICICERCMNECGSCSLFSDYEIPVTMWKQTSTRISIQEYNGSMTESSSFILQDSFCAIASSLSSTEPVWFVKKRRHHIFSKMIQGTRSFLMIDIMKRGTWSRPQPTRNSSSIKCLSLQYSCIKNRSSTRL